MCDPFMADPGQGQPPKKQEMMGFGIGHSLDLRHSFITELVFGPEK